MNIRLERAGRSLYNFLEDDLSGAHIGLGKGAQLHLERFRSFLHTYYVAQNGYWPPASTNYRTEAFPQAINQAMYFDFRNLYEYLGDKGSGISMQNNIPVDGGICVFQNVMNLDKRNKFVSLPHPLPLVPKVPLALSNGNTISRLFGNKQTKMDRRIHAAAALLEATNRSGAQVMDNGLVREYARFEKSWTMTEDATVFCTDARKVRWILVYAILQTLISVTRIPNEVRDTEGVSYPLCCQIAGTPPWPIRKPNTTRVPVAKCSRPTSLVEQIMEVGPDMDILSSRPSPSNPTSLDHNHSPSPPRKVSLTQRLSLEAPKPLRTKSWEILSQGYGDVSPLSHKNPNVKGSIEAEVSPIEPTRTPADKNVTLPEPQSNTSSPSTSEAGGSGRWSESYSEDGMEHTSVNGSGSDASNYGDDEDDERYHSTAKPLPLRLASKPLHAPRGSSADSFRAKVSNPEVDQYILS